MKQKTCKKITTAVILLLISSCMKTTYIQLNLFEPIKEKPKKQYNNWSLMMNIKSNDTGMLYHPGCACLVGNCHYNKCPHGLYKPKQ